MARRKKEEVMTVPTAVLDRVRPPLATVLGAPLEVADLIAQLGNGEVTCYQMDLYPAERLRAELDERGLRARVVTAADLWDLPADFQTVLYPAAKRSERSLKIDMVEQAFHILRPHGTLLVWSAYESDQLFPTLLKKVFGRVHAPASGADTVLWCQRDGERPRRRHEVVFQARVGDGPSTRFVSRPGIFSYGRFDEGARALVETMIVEPGERVLDIGCGCGTNGIFASQQTGAEGEITFIDSNLRAVALTEQNAAANGVARFQALASSRVEGVPERSIDVALANPPYFAQTAIARLFIGRAYELLRPGGRFYLVTKQANQVGPLVADTFGQAEAVQRRGYTIFGARLHTTRDEPESVFLI
jgi:23S rRNA (guanine1835-N2)-methyltransferase